MEIKTINDLVCLVGKTTLEKFLYKTKSDLKEVFITLLYKTQKTTKKDESSSQEKSNNNTEIEKFVNTISKNSFKNVSTIETLKISTKTNLSIEQSAFENCSKLKTIVLEMDSKDLLIQSDVFKSCNDLDCVHIKSASKITIEKNAFAQCYNLRVIVLESGNVKIRENAFESSNDLCIVSKSNKEIKDYCSKHNICYKEL